MKKNVKFILFLILIISFCALTFAEILEYTNDKNLTLSDSLELAQLNNRNLVLANEEMEVIKYKSEEALSFRLPQIDFLANFVHYDLETPFYLLNNGSYNFILDGTKNYDHSFKLGLSQIIYSGKKAKNIKKITESSTKKAKSEYSIIRNQVFLNIKLLFYKHLLSKKKVEFLMENKKYVEKILELKKNFHIALDDSFKIEEFCRNYKYDLEKYINDLETTKMELFTTIGIEQESLLNIVGEFKPISSSRFNLSDCINKALYLRPEIISSEALEEMGFLEINISNEEKNPVIALGASYQYSNDVLDDRSATWQDDWHVGINMNIPIFDGGAWLARNNQKKINLRKLKIRKSDVEENIKLEMKKVFLNYEFTKNKLAVEEKFYRENLQNLKIDDTNPKTANDFVKFCDSLKVYIQLDINYLNCIMEYNESLLRLYFCIGEV